MQLLAIELTPESHYRKATVLHSLGLSWETRLHHSRNPSHFTSAHNFFTRAVQSSSVSPEVRLSASLRAAKLCADFPELTKSKEIALRAHKYVVEAVSPLIWIGQNVLRRYERLSKYKIGTAIVQAASAAIAAHDHALALEWLEEGRSVVWGQQARLRRPLDDLRSCHPDLADGLEHVSDELQPEHTRDFAGSHMFTGIIIGDSDGDDSTFLPTVRSMTDGGTTPTSASSWIKSHTDKERRRYTHALTYDDLLARIRRCQGFKNFLRPRTLSKLAPACRNGPVAVVAVQNIHSDVLVPCPPGNVVHVPLPSFTPLYSTQVACTNVALCKRRQCEGPCRPCTGEPKRTR
jgi:hypothetical protein